MNMDGPTLKSELKLGTFEYVYIQKGLRVPFSLYVLTVNSRYPYKFIPTSHIKNSITASVYRIRPLKSGKLKLTPPIDLNYFQGIIKDGSIVFLRDLSGDMFADEFMYERKILGGNIFYDIN